MKLLRNIISVIALAAMCLAVFSCKKPKDEVKSYLKGTLSVDDISPVQPAGKPVTFHLYGVYHPDGKPLTISYTFDTRSDIIPVPFTSDGFDLELTMPETPASVQLAITVGPTDSLDMYYSSSLNIPILVVDPKTSVAPLNYAGGYTFVDPRDNQSYPIALIGNKLWFSRSLAYAGNAAEPMGRPFYNDIMDNPWGRFYTWEEAQHACPEGWRLPADEDFVHLAQMLNSNTTFKAHRDFKQAAAPFICKASFNGTRLWPYNPVYDIKDNSMFMALPAGYVNVLDPDFDMKYHNFKLQSLFWTADEANDAQAYFRYIILDNNTVFSSKADKASMAMNVRCVLDTNL